MSENVFESLILQKWCQKLKQFHFRPSNYSNLATFPNLQKNNYFFSKFFQNLQFSIYQTFQFANFSNFQNFSTCQNFQSTICQHF